MSKAVISRIRHSRDQWQAWIDEQKSSGLSEADFCAQKGLSLKRLGHWKRRLPRKRSSKSSQPPQRNEWIELTQPSHYPSGWDIELDLGQGLCLRLRRR